MLLPLVRGVKLHMMHSTTEMLVDELQMGHQTVVILWFQVSKRISLFLATEGISQDEYRKKTFVVFV